MGGRGFFYVMFGEEVVSIKPMLINGTYAIMKSYTKPYASCRYTHPAVEAAIHLKSKVKPEEVEEINIKTYSLAVAGHEHREIPGSYSAKMSIPYSTAVGLIYGKAGLQEFSEETVKNAEVLALTKKVAVEADKELSDIFPEIQAAIVTIKSKGDEFTERVDFPKGEPENPLTDEEFKDRYNGLMEYAGVAEKDMNSIFDSVNSKKVKVQDIVVNL